MGVEAIPFSAVFWVQLGLCVVGHWVLLAWPSFNSRGCYDFKLTGCLKVHWAGDSWINADDPSASIGLNPSNDISLFMHRNGEILYPCIVAQTLTPPPPSAGSYHTEGLGDRQSGIETETDKMTDERERSTEGQREGHRQTGRGTEIEADKNKDSSDIQREE
jgi:hypothetical protein